MRKWAFVARAMHSSAPIDSGSATTGMVVVLVGRRIDATDAERPRFPLNGVEGVAGELRACFRELGTRVLVTSAANGADLIALRVARALELRTRIVLPCSVPEFRECSVIDRPGDWGSLFDESIADAAARNDLIVIEAENGTHASFVAANSRMIDEARRLATAPGVDGPNSHDSTPDNLVGIVVWDGISRGSDDITASFVEQLNEQHIPIRHVSTLASTNREANRKGR